ncbi:hypothetical protein PLUTE_a6002 [Pseudoalteromonas luteoviolacea DSM 6061]|nr:hypothetical protein [Pseudoalteromonas luteoviolacea DSM 6061]
MSPEKVSKLKVMAANFQLTYQWGQSHWFPCG